MSGYTKLFSSILASTIWREPDHVRIVWITMLAMSTKDGMVEASIPGLADMARVSIELCNRALTVLESPDPYSRTTDNEGRRIARVDGGFLLLNHRKYRDAMSSEDRREYQRQWERKNRPDRPNHAYRQPITPDITPDNPQQNPTNPTHTDPDPDPAPGGKRSDKPTSPPGKCGADGGRRGISAAEMVVRDKELSRVETRMREIRAGYDTHQDMSQKDRIEIKALKARAAELKRILGMTV